MTITELEEKKGIQFSTYTNRVYPSDKTVIWEAVITDRKDNAMLYKSNFVGNGYLPVKGSGDSPNEAIKNLCDDLAGKKLVLHKLRASTALARNEVKEISFPKEIITEF